MQARLHRPIHLTYCTNMHPGESWDETFANLETYTLKIRERVAPGRSFGIGLWLSDRASLELNDPDRLAAFRDFLAARDCYVFTLNGFPFGRFHGTKVKENVYRPDWSQPERLDYTRRLAEILAALLPEGEEGSISTVPCTFKGWVRRPEQKQAMVRNLADCAFHFERVSRRSGRNLHLGLEPEPLCYLETVDELVNFFDRDIRTEGARYLEQSRGLAPDEARAILDRRLGICYDTCHMAVEFRRAAEELDKLDRAGIFISKFQISSALKLEPTQDALDELSRYGDDVYLHQVIARGPTGALLRYQDIGDAMAHRDALGRASELRVHCHVPLPMTRHRGLESTADHIDDLLAALKGKNKVAHFEVETYTWDVLPAELRADDLAEAVAGEIRWFMDRLASIDEQPFS